MTDKKTFGSFIRLKRTEKNYSQKELANLLSVTEGAISKWERGASYPDITLISDICRVLDISEHEFFTATNDDSARKLKKDARKFRIINGTWFWIPSIAYPLTLLICFICNLAVSHTLSWSFIVLAALVCAYSFVPTFTSFFKEKRLFVFSMTSFLSICLLLFTCAVYTGTLFWFPTAFIGVLMGYVSVFVPIFLSKTKISRYKFLITLSLLLIFTLLLLNVVNAFTPFMLGSAVLITLYAYLPVFIILGFCLLKICPFIKTGLCIFEATLFYYFSGYIVNALFGFRDNDYKVDFSNWQDYTDGNVAFICLCSLLFISLVFFIIGFLRRKK